MPGVGNVFKYSTSDAMDRSIRKGNVLVGTNNSLEYGPTKTGYVNPAINVDSTQTFWWNGTNPPSGQYVVWRANTGTPTTGEPSIAVVGTLNTLRDWVNTAYSQSFTNGPSAIAYLNANQLDTIPINLVYPDIVTTGLVQVFDAGYTPSAPRTGTIMYNLGSTAGATASFLSNGGLWFEDGDGVGAVELNNGGRISFTGSNEFYGTSSGGDFTWQIMHRYSGFPNQTNEILISSNDSVKNFSLLYVGTDGPSTSIRFETATEAFSSTSSGTALNGLNSTAGPLSGDWKLSTFVRNGGTCSVWWNKSQMWRVPVTSFSVGSTAQNVIIGTNAAGASASYMDFGLILTYNSAFGRANIDRNFDALAPRFGLSGGGSPPAASDAYLIASVDTGSSVQITGVYVNSTSVTRISGSGYPITAGNSATFVSSVTGTRNLRVDYSNSSTTKGITYVDSASATDCGVAITSGGSSLTFVNLSITSGGTVTINGLNSQCP